MNVRIDLRSGQPIYIQIVDQIRRQVAGGLLQPGDRLPTVRQLAGELEINFNTVARAYRILDQAGLISTQQGRGTYIWDAPEPQTIDRLRVRELDEMARSFLSEASRLGFGKDEVLAAIQAGLSEAIVETSK
jgi:GntR family transcriptional regulator